MDLLRSELSNAHTDQAYELARLRKKASERFEDPWELWFDEQGLRYATPDTVARARAQRLSPMGERVVDVACGVGIQLAFLAQAFDEAVGIERDPDKAALAERNLAALGVEAEIIVADALDPSIVDDVGDVDVVVCDPARQPEADRRVFDDLSPDIRKVHAQWGENAHAWCYELPPMMPPERVHEVLEGECEYTSLNGELNRLAVYGGELDHAQASALALPAGERLTDDDPSQEVADLEEPSSHLYLVDRAVLQAGLLEQLTARTGALGLVSESHPRRTLLTGDGPSGSALAEDFEVLAKHAWNLLGLNEKLRRLEAGKVTLRASIDPEEYWDVRNALEDGLEGERHVHLFRHGELGIIAEPTGDR